MSSVNSAISTIWFLLLTIFLVQGAIGDSSGLQNNNTDQSSTWILGRTKRQSPNKAPDSFLLKVKYETDTEINLFFIKSAGNLANKNLPVIIPFGDFHHNFMRDVGDFTTYHDIDKCAAVVYFKKLNALFGVIGTSYYIDGLPFALVNSLLTSAVGVPFVKKYEYPYSHIMPTPYVAPSDAEASRSILPPTETVKNQRRKRPLACEASQSAKHQRIEKKSKKKHTKVDSDPHQNVHQMEPIEEGQNELGTQNYYIEIAVFVARDIVEIFRNMKGKGDYNVKIVRHLITYFNAVDMMFQKAQMIKKRLYINIARIVIEDSLMPFEFMNEDELQFFNVVSKLPQYFRDMRLYNSPDSFDHVFIHTSRPILNGLLPINGVSKEAKDLYTARQTHRFYDAVPISMVRFESNYADYVTAVHEITRAFNIKLDPQNKGLAGTGQCYGIMQQDGAKCENCLKWSTESIDQLYALLSQNRNRCFLMNEPRSLHSLGVMPLSEPDRQCTCFGYDSHIATDLENPGFILSNECNKPMQCGITKGTFVSQLTVRPFDGTPCGPFMVCSDRICVTNLPTNYLEGENWSIDFV